MCHRTKMHLPHVYDRCSSSVASSRHITFSGLRPPMMPCTLLRTTPRGHYLARRPLFAPRSGGQAADTSRRCVMASVLAKFRFSDHACPIMMSKLTEAVVVVVVAPFYMKASGGTKDSRGCFPPSRTTSHDFGTTYKAPQPASV